MRKMEYNMGNSYRLGQKWKLLDNEQRLVPKSWYFLINAILHKYGHGDSDIYRQDNKVRMLLHHAKNNFLDLEASKELILWLKTYRKKNKYKKDIEKLLIFLIIYACAAHNEQIFHKNAQLIVDYIERKNKRGTVKTNKIRATLGARYTPAPIINLRAKGTVEATHEKEISHSGAVVERSLKKVTFAAAIRSQFDTFVLGYLEASAEGSGYISRGKSKNFKTIQEHADHISAKKMNSEQKGYLIFPSKSDLPRQRSSREQRILLLYAAYCIQEELKKELEKLTDERFECDEAFTLPPGCQESTIKSYGFSGALEALAFLPSLLPKCGGVYGTTATWSYDHTEIQTNKPISFLQLLTGEDSLSEAERKTVEDRYYSNDIQLHLTNYPLAQTKDQIKQEINDLATKVECFVSAMGVMQICSEKRHPQEYRKAKNIISQLMQEERVKTEEDLFGWWHALLYSYVLAMRELNVSFDDDEQVRQLITKLLATPHFKHNPAKLQQASGVVTSWTWVSETKSFTMDVMVPGCRATLQVSKPNRYLQGSADSNQDPTCTGEVVIAKATLHVGTNSAIRSAVNDHIQALFKSQGWSNLLSGGAFAFYGLEFPIQFKVSAICRYFKPKYGVSQNKYHLQGHWTERESIKALGGDAYVPTPLTGFMGVVGFSVHKVDKKMEEMRYSGEDVYWLLEKYFTNVSAWKKLCDDHKYGLNILLSMLNKNEGTVCSDLQFFMQRYYIYKHHPELIDEWKNNKKTLDLLKKLLTQMQCYWQWQYEKDEGVNVEPPVPIKSITPKMVEYRF